MLVGAGVAARAEHLPVPGGKLAAVAWPIPDEAPATMTVRFTWLTP